MKKCEVVLKNRDNLKKLKIGNFGFLIAIFVFSLFNFNLKDAEASFTISRPSINNIGLVGYWTFDGKNVVNGVTMDSSGNGYHANLINIATSTFYSGGKIGQGFNFDGVNDLASTTRINNNEITVSAWYYKNGNDFVAGASDSVFGAWYWNANTQLQEGFDLRPGTIPTATNCGASVPGYLCALFVMVTTNGTTKTQKSSFFDMSTISQNGTSTLEWFHIAGTYTQSDGNQRLYVNGVLRDTDLHVAGNTVVPLATTTTGACYLKMNIGYSCVNNGWFNGKIDDVRLYNRALSANEIKNLYNQGDNKLNKSQTKTLTSGLVGYWTFDGADTSWTTNTTVDLSGNGNTGTMTNMSTTSSPAIGKIGQGFNFDGVNDYVNAGNGSSLNVVGNITISAWVKFDNANDKDVIVSRDNGGPGNATAWSYEFGRDITTNKLFLYSDGSGGEAQSVNSSSVITDVSSWHHVAVTKSSSIVTFFIDGVLDNSATMTQNFPSTSHSLHIGTENYSTVPTEKFDGNIDDVRVYNRALTAAEIKLLYNMGR